ncbi:MgtC/SapB family protein [bacterium]|nr:MgtC/SapB family protein [bacterium]
MLDTFKLIVLPENDILIRIVLSIILGFALGLERELTYKWAGLRTNMLVCLGSCLFTILSIYGFSTAVSLYPIGDPSRVAAQVITGIGFIGGGTVLRHGITVSGLTTAATLWVVASIGMACGCGQLGAAILTTLCAIAVLVLIRVFELHIMPKNLKNLRKLSIIMTCTNENSDQVKKQLFDEFKELNEFTKKRDEVNPELTKYIIKAIINDRNPVEVIQTKIENIQNVESVSVKEIFD